MADIVPLTVAKQGEEENTSPVVILPNGDNEFKMNEIMEKQMKAFQDNFMTQFNEEYSEKLTKLQSDNIELEEKKQRLTVMEELRIAEMDSSLIDFVYDKDMEISKVKIKHLKDLIKIETNKGIMERLKSNSHTPPNGQGNISFNTRNENKPKYFV